MLWHGGLEKAHEKNMLKNVLDPLPPVASTFSVVWTLSVVRKSKCPLLLRKRKKE